MNRLLLTAVLAFFAPGVFAQNYNPKFDQGLDLKEFIQAATGDSSNQAFMPVPQVIFKAVETISLNDEKLPALKKAFPKPGAGYFYGPYPPRITNSGPYQNGQVYVPHLQGQEHPIAYNLLAQWDGINTTRGTLLDEANVLDPKDRSLYAEAAQLDQNAAALNQEGDKLNAEIHQFNNTCVGVPYPPSYCHSWSTDLDRRIADWKRRVDAHNAKVANFRARKKDFDGAVGSFIDKIMAWEKNINDFISKAAAFLSNTGDCTKDQHYQLQQVVNKACSPAIIRACEKGQDCDLLRENLRKFEACIKAREEINNTCFKGGDTGHIIQIGLMQGGADRCNRIIKEDCGGPEGACNGEVGVRRVSFETAN